MKSLFYLIGAPTTLGLLLLFHGCGVDSASQSPTPASATANSGYTSTGLTISSAIMSRDSVGKDVTTLFKPSEHTIYINLTLSGPGMGAKVRHVWTQVSNSFLPDMVLSDQEAVVDGDKNGINMEASYSEDWPVGTYKTDIYLNGKLERTLDWAVR